MRLTIISDWLQPYLLSRVRLHFLVGRWCCCLPILGAICCVSFAWGDECLPRHPIDSFRRSEIVFVGEAIRSKGLPTEYKIVKMYKGHIRSETVKVNDIEPFIGFKQGAHYLVFAWQRTALNGTNLFTSACLGSGLVRSSTIALSILDRLLNGYEPQNAVLVQPRTALDPTASLRLHRELSNDVIPLTRARGAFSAENIPAGNYFIECSDSNYGVKSNSRFSIADHTYVYRQPLIIHR